jgi:hypothetical protein
MIECFPIVSFSLKDELPFSLPSIVIWVSTGFVFIDTETNFLLYW